MKKITNFRKYLWTWKNVQKFGKLKTKNLKKRLQEGNFRNRI